MKQMLGGFIGSLALLTAVAGFGQQDAAFFRIVSPTNSRITALSSDGTLVWTNAATAGVTCMVQRATTLMGPSNWVDFVQHGVTNATMSVRVHDPNPSTGMRLIPAGTNNGTDPDFGAYSLTVSAFYMDATEVTKAQWDDVAAWGVTNGYTDLPAGGGKAPNHPVQTVSLYDCVKWCNARSEREGRTPCYTAGGVTCKTDNDGLPDSNFAPGGYRLPTKVEWEYAARGGLSGRRFPWGDTIDHAKANYYGYPESASGDAYDTDYEGWDTRFSTGDYPYTSPAGSFAANGYGLYDMAGNVVEWCADWDSGSFIYVEVRGGCWHGVSSICRTAWSSIDYPAYVLDIGFRTVCR